MFRYASNVTNVSFGSKPDIIPRHAQRPIPSGNQTLESNSLNPLADPDGRRPEVHLAPAQLGRPHSPCSSIHSRAIALAFDMSAGVINVAE